MAGGAAAGWVQGDPLAVPQFFFNRDYSHFRDFNVSNMYRSNVSAFFEDFLGLHQWTIHDHALDHFFLRILDLLRGNNSQVAGYADIENPVFFRETTQMLLGLGLWGWAYISENERLEVL